MVVTTEIAGETVFGDRPASIRVKRPFSWLLVGGLHDWPTRFQTEFLAFGGVTLSFDFHGHVVSLLVDRICILNSFR